MSIGEETVERTGALPGVGFVRGGVRSLLRIEGFAVLVIASAAYSQTGSSWFLFAGLFLVPDLSFLAYYGGNTFGAMAYNACHSYVLPIFLLLAGLVGFPELKPYALIWIAHIGFDRAVGYGLKYASAFGHTHLGLAGKAGPA